MNFLKMNLRQILDLHSYIIFFRGQKKQLTYGQLTRKVYTAYCTGLNYERFDTQIREPHNDVHDFFGLESTMHNVGK